MRVRNNLRAARLNRPSLRQLKQRISLRCDVKALSLFEINKYVRFRLKQAGAKNVNLFDNSAIGLIGHVSQGIPRVVNNICDNALLYGYAAAAEVITRDIIEEVIETLDLAPSGRNRRADAFDDEVSSGL
jgi:general secretion pathway protein A